MREVIFSRHVLKTLVSEVEEQVAGGASETHNPLIDLIHAVTIRTGRGDLDVKRQ